ncbi:MAG TPA: hypothetical protein DEP66_06655 [Acidimicrobiaceae bacterium]|nr:hypothetical protein [Acidimicrobiaceae bacterium]
MRGRALTAAPFLALALLVGASVGPPGDAPAGAQASDTPSPTETAETPAPASPLVAVVRGPGGIGYWVVTADGNVQVVGTAVDPRLRLPEPLDQSVVDARVGAPGALGVWLRLADGSEVALGDPGPNVYVGDDRPPGWLVGVGTGRLLSGSWWPDIDTACTAGLPRHVRIGQTVLTTLSELEFGTAVAQARDHRVGGILLTGGATPHVWRRIDELQDFAGWIPLMFAVDEEGGRVQRLRGVLPALASAAVQAGRTPAQAGDDARRHALAMSDLGFTVNFAPVLDVGAGPGIGDRSFGDDPAVVTDYGLATVNGIAAGGVLAVVKHFPGHGGASADTHLGPATTAALDRLRVRDLLPFAAAVGEGNAAVMVGHLDVPGLTDGMPASLSHAAVTGLLRDDLGHDGLVVTDSLVMNSIAGRWSVGDAAALAIVAGADLALVGGLDDAEAAFAAVAAAADDGRLTESRLNDAATHVLRAKGVYSCTLVGRVGQWRPALYDPAARRS